MLLAFLRAPGRVLSRDHLLDAVAGRQSSPYDRSIDVLVSRLRRKIEPDPQKPRLILTVPGLGYKFAAKVQPAEPPAAPNAETPSLPGRHFVTLLAAELVPDKRRPLHPGPEDLRTQLEIFRRCVSAIVARHGGLLMNGHVRQVIACFGYPLAAEYAAEQAIRAGLALLEELPSGEQALPATSAVRIGAASSMVIAGPGAEVVGEAPGDAVRMLMLARPGQFIIDATTQQLASGQFTYRVVGPFLQPDTADPVRGWLVLGQTALCSRSEALYFHPRTPLVNREEERTLLLHAWRQAKLHQGRLVLLSGEAGIGKSRLLAELENELAGEQHAGLRYFCSPLHQDSPLHPIIARWQQEAAFRRQDTAGERLRKLETLPSLADLPPEDFALIAATLSVATDGRYPQLELSPRRQRERAFSALLRSLVNCARRQPVLLLFEDAQWADPSSIELISMLVDRLSELPILLVILFRPEFAAPWIGRAGTSLIVLSRLDRKHSAMLAAQVSAGRALRQAVLDRIVAMADGVPLFIEELTKAVLENPGTEDAVAPPAIPDTLQASLMARFDKSSAAKEIAQAAAVIGREFSHALLAKLLKMPEAQLRQGLNELETSALVSRRGTAPDAIYIFRHALLQEAAYESLSKRKRAAFHAGIVAAAEGDRSLGLEPAVLGHHCAQAGLITKAANYYHLAAMRSLERAASVETRRQLERGLEFAASLPQRPDRGRLEAELLVCLGEAQQLATSYADNEADKIFLRALSVCRRLQDKQPLARALAGRSVFLILRGQNHEAQAAGEELLTLARGRKDPNLYSIAQTMIGSALLFRGKFASAQEHLKTSALFAARPRQGDRAHLVHFT